MMHKPQLWFSAGVLLTNSPTSFLPTTSYLLVPHTAYHILYTAYTHTCLWLTEAVDRGDF
jgi:hypothetical protein